ncbi:nucleoside 5-triphosphatase RdgB [Dehalogenimonas sp. WBC-2]|nr:nucleoside 5-triphosphatase RdgB [Dehalogenimonas sp. WBC-2]
MPELLLATNNKGKVREYHTLLRDCGYRLVTPADKGISIEVPEIGKSFVENAVLKAKAFAAVSGLLTLADDSGLEVDALGGAPGIYSARYAGDKSSDTDNIDLLLHNLTDVPEDGRSARFRCVIAIVSQSGGTLWTEGKVEGTIASEAKGRYGFGYDPVFYLPELGKTMAELTPEEKNCLSHRASAASAACRLLKQMNNSTQKGI